MNIIIQKRHNDSKSCVIVKLSRKTKIFEICFANEESGLVFIKTEYGRNFGTTVGFEFRVMLRRKGPHKPQFAYDIVRIHSLKIFTDLIEYNIVDDAKTPLLRCFPFISKLKAGDIITTGEYKSYQSFSNLQFRPLLKKLFHSIHIDLSDPSGYNNEFGVMLRGRRPRKPKFSRNFACIQSFVL